MPSSDPTKPQKRQFSLRALFVALAAVSAVCALFPALGTETAVYLLSVCAFFGILAWAIHQRSLGIGLLLLVPIAIGDAMLVPRSWAGQSSVAFSVQVRDEETSDPVAAEVVLEQRDGTKAPAKSTGVGQAVLWCECLTLGSRQAFASTHFATIPADDYLCINAPGYQPVRSPLADFFDGGTWDLKKKPRPSLTVHLRKVDADSP